MASDLDGGGDVGQIRRNARGVHDVVERQLVVATRVLLLKPEA
jgi:hypothetical protein